MTLSLVQSQTITEIANLVADFLPATFNNTTSFPIAAKNAGVERYWSYEGGKRGSVARMLKASYEENPRKMLAVIKQIVELGLIYRSKKDKNPIARSEIITLNELIRRFGYEISSLNDPEFLKRLADKIEVANEPPKHSPVHESTLTKNDPSKCASLLQELMAMVNISPQERGYVFEAFLNKLFEFYKMAPRRAFRNRGEQIDGSFIHRHETFLLEAKWQSRETAIRDLYTFASKVETKAAWGRGLFISEAGFTEDGLFAFRQGKPTSIVCMDGYDLYLMLQHALDFEEVLDLKKRHAAETGSAFVMIKDLYPSLS